MDENVSGAFDEQEYLEDKLDGLLEEQSDLETSLGKHEYEEER